MRAYVVMLAVVLSNCSASEIIQDWTLAPAPDLSQPDYRRIVGKCIHTILPNSGIEMEISDVRRFHHYKGPAWLTCLKFDAGENIQYQLQQRKNIRYLAIFIQNNKIIEWRTSLVIDQCHNASYTPFEIPIPAEKPVPNPKPQIECSTAAGQSQ
jgi:hypothetical protein